MEARNRRFELAGVRGISDVLLSKLWKRFRDEPDLLEQAPSKDTFYRDAVRESKSFGQALPLTLRDDETFQWFCSRPQDVLVYLCSKSPKFNALVDKSFGRSPELVISYDEITPGNVLRPDNKREYYIFSASFKDFGSEIASKACLWMPFAILRSSVIKKVNGGLSRCLRDLLLSAFGFVGKTDGMQHGIVLQLPSGPRAVVVRVSNNLADEAALSNALGLKGASGLLPCCKCTNIVKRGTKRKANPHVHDITCHDPTLFHARTDEHC